MATTTTETETVREPEAGAPPADRPRPYRIPIDLYERMAESGVFGDTSPIYLWKGQLVLPMTKGPSHEYALNTLLSLLVRLVPGGWHVRAGSPTRVPDDSEPEPDLTVLRGANRDYRTRTADAADVSLAVEVSDSSLRHDSGEKLEAYAAASIPCYWVVNIPEQRVDVYTRPTGPVGAGGPRYEGRQRFEPGEDVPVVLDGREVGRVAAGDLLV